MKSGSPSHPVRISARHYRELRKIAKANGHSMFWFMNYIIDLYFQDVAANADKPKFPSATQSEGQAA